MLAGRVWQCLGIVALIVGATAAVAIARSPISPSDWARDPVASFDLARGDNPHPVVLVRPPSAPLSAMAQLGRTLFFDPQLSSSRRLSCASCHDPHSAFGPPGPDAVMLGGPALTRPGVRAVPSLMYLERQPNFTIGPESAAGDDDLPTDPIVATRAGQRSQKPMGVIRPADALVPQGGLFWDGRVDTLQGQALGPMLNPAEMDGHSVGAIAAKLRRTAYVPQFVRLFGPMVLGDAQLLVSEAAFAIARYEFEDAHFHPYSSKFDFWLEGKARLSPAELRGYLAFNDPRGANCAACHLDAVGSDGLPPLFTDHEFEALGAPRNRDIPANRDSAYFDLGVCGPIRTSLRDRGGFCGMFLTPTLRNVAVRHAFFHNGVFPRLRDVLNFYDFRDTAPDKVYPRGPDGTVRAFDDIPSRYRANVDTTDGPFGRAPGAAPAMSPQQIDDIIAFLRTLTDGARPAAP